MCGNEHALADAHADALGDIESEWLNLIRLHCTSYEQNKIEGWDRAIGQAEMRYGADNGPLVASRVAVLIRAMRAERSGGFGYLSPFCPNCRLRVTEDEQLLIALMRAGYRGVTVEIDEAAAEFAGRSHAPILAAAAARFGKTAAAAIEPRGRSMPAPSVQLH